MIELKAFQLKLSVANRGLGQAEHFWKIVAMLWPATSENRAVIHKISDTGGDIKTRVSNAKKAPTFLLANVEIVAAYQLANIDRKKIESLLHGFFAAARLDLELKDRFGLAVEPREWFLEHF